MGLADLRLKCRGRLGHRSKKTGVKPFLLCSLLNSGIQQSLFRSSCIIFCYLYDPVHVSWSPNLQILPQEGRKSQLCPRINLKVQQNEELSRINRMKKKFKPKCKQTTWTDVLPVQNHRGLLVQHRLFFNVNLENADKVLVRDTILPINFLNLINVVGNVEDW